MLQQQQETEGEQVFATSEQQCIAGWCLLTGYVFQAIYACKQDGLAKHHTIRWHSVVSD
jgi:hypothetical protein